MKPQIPNHSILIKNNFKAIHFTISRLLLLILILYLLFGTFKLYFIFKVVLIFVYFIIFSFLGMAGISHELLHNTVFVNKKWNQFFYRIFSIITFSNYAYFEISHWEHHRKALSNDDPKDLFVGKLPLLKVILWCTFDFISFFNRIKIFILNSFNIIPSTKNDLLFKKPLNISRIALAARVTLFFHFSLIVLAFIMNFPFLIVFVSLAPFIFTFPNKILAISQHYGLKEDENLFNSCRSVLLPSWLSYLYANMNFHVEHHFFPGIPAYNLKKAHKYLISDHKASYKNLSIGLVGLFRDLKLKGLF